MAYMKKLKIICACGSSIATSTIMASNVNDLLESKGYSADIKKTTYSSLDEDIKSFQPDLVLTSTNITVNAGVPVLLGLPYLTGVGKKDLEKKILDIVGGIKND